MKGTNTILDYLNYRYYQSTEILRKFFLFTSVLNRPTGTQKKLTFKQIFV